MNNKQFFLHLELDSSYDTINSDLSDNRQVDSPMNGPMRRIDFHSSAFKLKIFKENSNCHSLIN